MELACLERIWVRWRLLNVCFKPRCCCATLRYRGVFRLEDVEDAVAAAAAQASAASATDLSPAAVAAVAELSPSTEPAIHTVFFDDTGAVYSVRSRRDAGGGSNGSGGGSGGKVSNGAGANGSVSASTDADETAAGLGIMSDADMSPIRIRQLTELIRRRVDIRERRAGLKVRHRPCVWRG